MKGILFLFLGLLSGAASVCAQATRMSPWPDSGRILLVGPQPGIRIMKPDGMPCLMADLARLERMPTLRSSNSDPMPNGFYLPGRRIIGRSGPFPGKPDEK
ncbi:MAG TPA: hypothetical protein VMH27_04600 [Puia sp.]|nr:hypothetical protein [Puia sp.]